ncbi:MAG TPA: maleylpyruvate isomerase family mycothiol-dependent enzyme, partial [Acidimicrobiales bacterium]|nr:maleylpyruvate isomerase family mycothiol-dependent enzyme [Acidimicrobiales bacterium]
MTLSREVVVPGMQVEYVSFADLVRGRSDQDWDTPSRCQGWRVADVAAHVVGQLTDVVNFRLDGLGTPEVTERQVAERRGRAPGELADELDSSAKVAVDLAASFDDAAWVGPVPGGGDGTLGFGLEALWFDTYLHGDDIRDAL